MERVEIDAIAPRPIDNMVAHPSIWLDETAADEVACIEKAIELIVSEKLHEALAVLETKRHYWNGVRDGNRFLRNPFEQSDKFRAGN